MKNLLVSALAIILISLAIQAQSGLTVSSNGVMVRDSENGYSFVAPNDWANQAIDGGYVMINAAKSANIIVKPHTYNDYDSFVSSEVNLESEGYKLAEQIRDLGNGGRFARIYNSVRIIDVFFLLSPNNGGVIVLSVTTNATTANSAFNVAYQIVKSVQYSSPQPTSKSSQYRAIFSGKQFTNIYSGNGYFEERVIWLCPSGSYFSKVETGSSSAIGSGSTYSEDSGTWTVQGNENSVRLILNSNKGKGQRNFAVTAGKTNETVMMNNLKYFVGVHNKCR